MSEPASAGRVDGRTARAERTRRAIVDALLALNSDGELRPGAERIAERAGVSLRAVWSHFPDLETLYAAVGQRLIERQREEYSPIDPALPLRRRVEAFCAQRALVLEALAPVARSAQLREPFSPALRRNREQLLARGREEVERLFATELPAAGPRRATLLHALIAATTWPSWSALRDHLGLPVDDARAAMTATVAALLAAAVAG